MLDQLHVAFLQRLRTRAAHDNALARGHSQVARGAHRLAVATLHTGVDLVFDLRVELEVLHVLALIVGDDHARVHHPARVGGALERRHHVVEFLAVLAAHVRRHDAAGAVLCLEVAAGAEHEVHHVLVEAVVTREVLVALEAVGDQKVDVAVLGVAEDDGVVVPVGVEKLLQPAASVGEVLDGHRDVLEQRGRAGRASLRDLGVEALAERPRPGGLDGVGAELRRGLQVELTQELGAGLLVFAQLLGLVGVVFDEQRRLAAEFKAGDLLRHRIEGAANLDGARVHQLQRRRLRLKQCRKRARRGVQCRVDRDGGCLQFRHLDGAQDGLCDERERALGCDQQVHEDVQRRVVIQKRVQAVAHRVLEREVALDDVYGFLVVAHTSLELLDRVHELRLLARELRLRIRVGGVDHRAGRQDEGDGLDGVVGVELRTARHAGGVVGNHATHRRGALGCRVRADLAAERGQVRVDLAHRGAGLDAHALATVKYLHAAEVLAHVHQHARAACLAGQGGTAAAKHHWGAGGCRRAERRRDIIRVARFDHHIGGVEEVGCVVGVLDAVDRARGQRLVGAEFAGQMRRRG